LVERRQHPADRRARLLFLTEEAHPLIEAGRKIGDITRTEALEGLPQADRDALLRVLTTMKSNLVEACDRPASVQRSSKNG
jgi:DNA-binding MarR family transcriptional regulator